MSAQLYAAQIAALSPARRTGHVKRIASGHVVASGPCATLGALCQIDAVTGGVIAEVAAIEESEIVLVPLHASATIEPGAPVHALHGGDKAPVGESFSGRAVNAFGEAIDGASSITPLARTSLSGEILAPLDRCDPNVILQTGLRAIDGLLTLGRGQRAGIFSASGVGKTSLIRQIAAQVSCDRCILCLVGERGREVEAAWRALSANDASVRYTLVAATSDQSPSVRVRAVHQALALAEHWRTVGEHVVLIVDSITRYAMALREIGLAAGAPPTVRAYTPNVFSALPRVVERCGAARQGGAITAIFTVLSETDDVDDPIVEIMKSLLDGHIVLSRDLAEQGHFPPIDVARSVSRHAERLMGASHAAAARRSTSWLAAYDDARILIDSGLYKSGANVLTDEAIKRRESLLAFLRQSNHELSPLEVTLSQLERLAAPGSSHARA